MMKPKMTNKMMEPERREHHRWFAAMAATMLLLCLVCFGTGMVQAQETSTINGVVTSGIDGQPLAGVSVRVKGGPEVGATDADGRFAVNAAANATLVFTYIGYETYEATVTGATLNVVLQESSQGLDEVVVIGYGTQKRENISGAIATISADDMVTEGFANVGQALQGKVSGVQIESGGGNPGSGVRILIRGTGSLNNNNPLYIVDGVQVDDINNLAQSDIASMDILKDASAAAIYGSRAANGVVLITTKSGVSGENKIDLKASYGFQQFSDRMDVLNAEEWASVSNLAHDNAGLARLQVAEDYQQLNDVDWQDEIYRTAPMQNYNLNIHGGSEQYRYSLSGDYLGQDGIVKETGYEKYNLRLKSDFTKGRLKIGETIIFSDERWRNMAGGWGGQGGGPVASAAKMIPVFSVYDENAVGGYGGAYGPVLNVANPVAQLMLDRPEVYAKNLIINAFAEFRIIDGLNYRYNAGYTNVQGRNFNFTAPYEVGSLFVNRLANLSENRNERNVLLQEHTLNFNRNIGKGSLDVLAGYTYQNSRYRDLSGGKSGMPDGIEVIDAGTANTATGGRAWESTLVSFFGRVMYTYDNRYNVTAILRRDGSSRFGQDYQYGNFPSFAAAWNVHNEPFFEGAKSTFNTLKVRAGYGELGNQEISDYQFLANIQPNINYVIGRDQQLMPGATQTAFATPDIRWENSSTLNVGLDLGFFDNRLNLTTDYFIKKSTDVLLQVPIPLSTGASASSPYINAGSIENKGFEADISYSDQKGDFSYSVNGTIAVIKNKVLELGTGSQQIFGGQPNHHGASSTVTQAGWPIGAFFLIKTDGIFQSDAEVEAYQKDGKLIQPNAKAGDIRFVDANNDGIIDQSDRQYIGNSTPDFSFGIGGNVQWRSIDLNLFFQGTQGNMIYNGLRQDLEGMNLEMNYSKETLNAWSPTNTNTDIPRAVINDPNLNSQTSSRFVESGSYLRLRTLQLGYTFADQLLAKLGVSNARIYVSGDNLLTFTKYKGYNPDIGRTGSILNRGVDYGHVAYPLAQTYTMGIQVSF